MNEPNTEIPRPSLLTLALETWRALRELEKMREQGGAIGLRYSLRKIKGALEELGISYLDLTGKVYDSGMSLDVIDVEGEEGEALVIKEMMAPIILLNGSIIAWGEAILERRGQSEPINR
jgi:hypothetical protein